MRLITRKNREVRLIQVNIIYNRIINKFIKNGSVGDLDLQNTPISKLPPTLTHVYGDLDIRKTNITDLSHLQYVQKNLVFSFTDISHLPKNLIVEKNIYCFYTPYLRKMKYLDLVRIYPKYCNGLLYNYLEIIGLPGDIIQKLNIL